MTKKEINTPANSKIIKTSGVLGIITTLELILSLINIELVEYQHEGVGIITLLGIVAIAIMRGFFTAPK